MDLTVADPAEELGWAFFGPLIEATATVLGQRTPAERAVVDAFLDDTIQAVSGVRADDRAGRADGAPHASA